MAGKFPEKYNNPLYVKLDKSTTQKLGLPNGLLESIRINGERSNASQVSSAGAATPYQFIPSTRKAILDKYGIDVALSPENASEGAGLLLKESLDRNGGDVETAVREYHGGTSRDNWGNVNDAYAGRVLKGYDSSKIDALSQGFADFLAKNPASAPAPESPNQAAPQPANDPLSQGFGAWLDQQANPVSGVNAIPEAIPGANARLAAEPVKAPQPEPGLIDKIVGAGETGLTLATGATGGALGTIGGALGGLAGSIINGQFGTQEGVQNIEQAAAQGGQALTYVPRTESGQQQVGAVGEVLNAAVPALPLTAELGALGRGASVAGTAASDVARAAVPNAIERVRSLPPTIAERVQRTLSRNPAPEVQAGGGSVGAQGADVAAQRIQTAEGLPVPIQLTKGQATREQVQTSFEKETAKGPSGERLRQRQSEQNVQVPQNFDAWIDQTGAQAYGETAVGKSVTDAIRSKAARDKAEIRTAYTKALKSPEAENPVTLDGAITFLNENSPSEAVSPLLVAARKKAVQLGIAAEDNGQLIPLETNVKTAELYRRAIGEATDYEPTNIRNAAQIKGAIDSATEPLAGPLFRDARRKRELYARQYEDRAVISKLLNNKRGTGDRQVALQDVFNTSILNGTRESIGHLRRVLLASDQSTPPAIKQAGQQAWADIQGQLLNHLKDDSLKNAPLDNAGNPIFSAAQLNKNVRKLDQDGTLQFVLGKKGAENVRDLNEISKLIFTAPPGSVNTSGTAATLLAAIGESGLSGALTGLPVPILTTAKFLAGRAKEYRLQKRITEALEKQSRNQQTQNF